MPHSDHKTAHRMPTWDRVADPEQKSIPSAVDWEARSGGGRGLLRRLERLAMRFETPVNKLTGIQQLNPFYHTGTIAFFLLAVVSLTGLYLFIFYQYGHDISYESVAKMEQFIISRAARLIHRYASAGLMIFGTLHAIRMFFMDRFRSARWLGWVGGVAMMIPFWLAGVTGYWLIWDQVAQLITQSLLNLLKPFPGLAAWFYLTFLTESGAATNSWLLMLFILVIHVVLTALAGLFYWYHIKRLSRPKFFPPRFWMVGLGVLLFIVSVFSSGMFPRADFTRLPDPVTIDPFFLFYLPPSFTDAPARFWLIAAGLLLLSVAIGALPWLYPRKKLAPVKLTAERCTGCGWCAADCPYKALEMVNRDDGSPFDQLAVVNDDLCVSCGICVGSCNTLALSLDDRPVELLWQNVAAQLQAIRDRGKDDRQPVRAIFACERHAAQAKHEFGGTKNGSVVVVMPLACVAMAHPNLISRTFEAGADQVQIVGCPPDDCTNREGNLWLEERLRRERSPKLKQAASDAPIFTTWLSPDQFSEAMRQNPPKKETPPPETEPSVLQAWFPYPWQKFALALALLAVGLLVQVWLTYVPFAPYSDTESMVQLVAYPLGDGSEITLLVDGDSLLIADGSRSIFEEIRLPAGAHHLQVIIDGNGESEMPFDEIITLGQRQIVTLAFGEGATLGVGSMTAE